MHSNDADVATAGADESGWDEQEVLLSAIEHYSYCPRQCALIHVEQTYAENVFTIRGTLAHERPDSGSSAPSRGVQTLRAIPLWSDHYKLRGKADVVELRNGVPYPVEYKVGRRNGMHCDYQLCAQALCLEEMFGQAVTHGAIYYVAQRKRHEVTFDDQLRAETLQLVEQIRTMLVDQSLPNAPNDERCPNCSLINACLPHIVGDRDRLRGIQSALFQPIAWLDREDW